MCITISFLVFPPRRYIIWPWSTPTTKSQGNGDGRFPWMCGCSVVGKSSTTGQNEGLRQGKLAFDPLIPTSAIEFLHVYHSRPTELATSWVDMYYMNRNHLPSPGNKVVTTGRTRIFPAYLRDVVPFRGPIALGIASCY